jgi:hypothetical protein
MTRHDKQEIIRLEVTPEVATVLLQIIGHHIVGTMITSKLYDDLKDKLGMSDAEVKELPLSHVTTNGTARLAFPYPTAKDIENERISWRL